MLQALDRTATLAQIVAEHRSTVRVFERHDIDLRRRGDATVLEVCRERYLDPDEVFAQLEAAIMTTPGERRGDPPRCVPNAALVSHIVENHHAFVRRALPLIIPLLAKIAGRYGRREARLSVLCDVGQQLADALDGYMDAEEQVLFPALVAGAGDIVRHELPRMRRQQRDIEHLLSRVRTLADGFVAPPWADNVYRMLLEELRALDEEVTEELRLESYVVLPRMASARVGNG